MKVSISSVSDSLSLPLQIDSIDNFSLSNTPSRDDDRKFQVVSHSRSPSTTSDLEPLEVLFAAHTRMWNSEA